jgi:hypothetical protein
MIAPILNELLVGLLHDDWLDLDRAENFHGALGDHGGARVNCRSPVIFDYKRAYAVMGEQNSRGHSDQASAHNQGWGFNFLHVFRAESRREPRPR